MANGDNSGSPLSPVIGETSFSEAISEAVNKTVFPETALTQSSVVSPAQQPLAQCPPLARVAIQPLIRPEPPPAAPTPSSGPASSRPVAATPLPAVRCPLLAAFFTYVAAAAAFRAVGLRTCFACVATVAWSAS